MRLFYLMVIIMLISCNKTAKDHYEKKSVALVSSSKGYQLMRNGQVFKIRGAAGSPDYIKELADFGGNTIRLYDTLHLKSHLDTAQKYNLAVIVDIPLSTYESTFHTSEENRKNTYKKIEVLVNKHKNHPALLVWMLGNEIRYPSDVFPNREEKAFISFYNSLIDLIHETDPNHPVTTSIASVEKRKIINIARKSPQLDFISFNIFGQIHSMKDEIDKIEFFWDGPFLISEWSMEGPWTDLQTLWKAPIEQTDSKKAEQLQELYTQYIDAVDERCLGDLAFFWGYKQERTPTWFSFFDAEGRKNNMTYSLGKHFKADTVYAQTPPDIEYILLNNKGSRESIVLKPEETVHAQVFHDNRGRNPIIIKWEVMEESWNVAQGSKEQKPKTIHLTGEQKGDRFVFSTPKNEGPYRLFVYLYDQDKNYTTSNIPFYVLK